jgi:hypothetical protein
LPLPIFQLAPLSRQASSGHAPLQLRIASAEFQCHNNLTHERGLRPFLNLTPPWIYPQPGLLTPRTLLHIGYGVCSITDRNNPDGAKLGRLFAPNTFLAVTPLGRIPAKVPTEWKLAHETTVDEAASLPEWVGALRRFDGHALLNNQWIALIGTPLLVERGNAPATAICNDIPNPLRIQRARSPTAFTS